MQRAEISVFTGKAQDEQVLSDERVRPGGKMPLQRMGLSDLAFEQSIVPALAPVVEGTVCRGYCATGTFRPSISLVRHLLWAVVALQSNTCRLPPPPLVLHPCMGRVDSRPANVKAEMLLFLIVSRHGIG